MSMELTEDGINELIVRLRDWSDFDASADLHRDLSDAVYALESMLHDLSACHSVLLDISRKLGVLYPSYEPESIS